MKTYLRRFFEVLRELRELRIYTHGYQSKLLTNGILTNLVYISIRHLQRDKLGFYFAYKRGVSCFWEKVILMMSICVILVLLDSG